MKKRSLPIRPLDPRVLLGDIAVGASPTYLTGFAFDDSDRLVAVAHGATAPHLVVSARESPALTLLACDGERLIASADRQLVGLDARTGALSPLVDTPAAMTTSLALDGEWVYGTVIGPDGGVFRAPSVGGAFAWIHRGRATALAVSRGRIAFSDGAHLWLKDAATSEPHRIADAVNPGALAFADDELFWGGFTPEGSIRAINLATGDLRVVASAPYTSALVVLGDHLYWAQASSRKSLPWIWRARRDAASPAEPLVHGSCKLGRLAGYGATLAWCGGGEGGAYALDVAALSSAP